MSNLAINFIVSAIAVSIALLFSRLADLSWEVSVIIATAALIGLWFLLSWQPSTKNKGLEAFPGFLRSLYLAMENGSFLKIRHRDSDIEFSFTRVSGEERQATVELRIPRADWSVGNADRVFEAFRAQGFKYKKEDISTGLFATVTLDIPNVWDSAAGTSGAHAARTLIRSVGLAEDTRFDVRMSGESSKRLLAAEDQSV